MSAGEFVFASDLSKWYGQVVGLNHVTVALQSGVTGLLGPNGAGKSTFLKLVSGQLRPSRGEVRLLGEEVFGNHRLMTRIGLCSDVDSFYEEMSGRRFLTEMLRLSGFSRASAFRQAGETLSRVGLEADSKRRIAAYSKGMRQRLNLAQAIAHDPEALLLDEPLNGLDPVGRAAMVKLIREMGEEGRSVLVSSHVLHEVEAMTEQVLLIHQGTILAEGRISDIRDLLDQHPRQVRIACSDPRGLASHLVEHDDVVRLSVLSESSSLLVETTRPDDFYHRLPGLLRTQKISLHSLESPDEGLRAVFNYLVKE